MSDARAEYPVSAAVEGPSAPREAYFDPQRDAWILSRYPDVRAAFHEPNLWLTGPDGHGLPDAEGRATQAGVRLQALAAFPAGRLAQWEAEFEALAWRMAAALPASRPIDVAAEFAFPWALQVAVRVTGADPADAQHLSGLAAKVSAGTARPEDGQLKEAAAAAGEALDRAIAASPPPMAGATFVALSQTLPCLLANGWLLLLGHPHNLEELRGHAKLVPRAVEEMLRLGGLARVLHRRALADVVIGGVRIDKGQRVDLMVEIANQDEGHFPSGHALDLHAGPFHHGSHFALGAGQHACAAASLIRMAVTVATKVFVQSFGPAAQADPVEWRGGSGFRWAARVYAQRRA